MLRYIVRKILYGFLVLFGVITAIFFLFNAKPGDPARLLGGNHATEEVVENIKRDLGLDLPLYQRYALYLNDLSPISIHNKSVEKSRIYLDTAKYNATELFDWSDNRTVVFKMPYLRRSYQNKSKVSDIIAQKLPNTVILALTSMILATILGIFLGVISAVNKGTFFDNSSFIFAVTGMSAPSFFMAAIISVVGGVKWAETMNLPAFPVMLASLGVVIGLYKMFMKKVEEGDKRFKVQEVLLWGLKGFLVGFGIWLVYIIGYSIFNYGELPLLSTAFEFGGTGLNPSGPLVDLDDYTGKERYFWENLVLPSITLGIRPLAIVTQLTRSSMLEVLSQDYIRTAKAKGLSFFKIVVVHALKNALNPVITAISGWFASLLAGSVFVEQVFAWDGLGEKLVAALLNDDLPIVMGTVIVISSFFVVIQILVDITYGFLDPRVRVR